MAMFRDKIIELGCGGNGGQRGESGKERVESVYSSESYKQSKVAESSYKPENDKGLHIIVLVHGYQASRQDFQVLKLCL